LDGYNHDGQLKLQGGGMPQAKDIYKTLFNEVPVAIVDFDYSGLSEIQQKLKGVERSEIRQYLYKHATQIKAVAKKFKVGLVNDTALSLYGVRTAANFSEALVRAYCGKSFDVFVEQLVSLLSGEGEFSGELKCSIARNRQQDIFIRVSVPKKYGTSLGHVLVTLQDITAWKRIERKLRKEAQIDGMTRLYNQSAILDKLDIELIRAKRYGLELSCMMIDLDFFKVINDKFGHQKGDQILKKVADMIKDCFRKVDVIGRYGGDEFVVILPETSARNANFAAQRLQKIFAKTLFRYKNVIKFYITLSIGIAGYSPKKAKDAKDLLALADNAMYDVKKAGRNAIKIAKI